MTYVPPPSRDGLRLHLNENTAGCSAAVMDALRRLERRDTACYPDYRHITSVAERALGVESGWLQLTNGLDEGLHITALAAARLADRPSAVIPEPAFEMYAACADAAGLRRIHVAPRPDLSFSAGDVLAAVDASTRLINITDPGNPTGLGVPAGAIEQILASARDSLVLVDEAYADFSGRSALAILDRHRSLIVGRTFAKAHGLAGLRAGALIAHPETLDKVRRLQPPYSLNICAVRALEAALNDRDYLRSYVSESASSRRLLYDFAERHGFEYWRSEANFVLIRAGSEAVRLVESLASRGILIRDRSSSPGCAGCLRVTAGFVTDTRTCIAALEDVLATRAN